VDLSSLIFVALFVAWAVYLVPKALRHHEEDAVSRSVDGFSDRLRVLARREAVSSTEAELVAPGAPARTSAAAEKPAEEVTAAPTPAPRASAPDVRRGTSAAARRRRVLSVLVLANLVVGGLVAGAVVSAWWTAAPASLLVAWLVACRLMARRERAARTAAARRRRRTLADEVLEAETFEAYVEPDVIEAEAEGDVVADLADDDTGEIPAISAELFEESAVDGWAPVSVPLPTYVAKAPAGRTVRTIDLDSTGVWSSGRNDADSQLAREADAQRAASASASAADDEARERRTGS
jgi:hypothetical protein